MFFCDFHLSSVSQKAERQSRGEELRDPPFDENVNTDDQQIIQHTRGDRAALQNEWIKLAVAIDRVAFIAYTLVFAMSAMIYAL